MNPEETKRLYYFTAKQWGLKAIRERRLKIAQYKDVNEPFELAPFDLTSRKVRRFWTERVARLLDGNHGILCFSEDWQSTLMWSHYSEKHTGLCLGFDVPRRMAEPIRYIDQPLREPVDPKKQLRGMAAEVLESALRCKHAGWSHEREWRLRLRLDAPVDGIYYKDFDDELHLREVIMGPRCSLELDEVQRAVSNPPMDVEIFRAQASHGAFEVCRHLEATPQTVRGFRARLAKARDLFDHDLPDEDPPDT